MATVDGVMKMRPLPAGIEIKPGETVELKPGSFHMMFMELKQPLTQGRPVKGTLVFEKAGAIEIEYAVAPIGASAPPRADTAGTRAIEGLPRRKGCAVRAASAYSPKINLARGFSRPGAWRTFV